MKGALERLQSLLHDSELEEQQKAEALSKLKELADSADKSATEKQSVLMSVMGYLSGISGFLKAGEEIKKILEQVKTLFK